MIVGPIQFTFMYCELRGSPRRHISSPRTACRHGLASAPPYSRGQLWVSQPFAARRGQNSRAKAACASLPGPSFAISSQSGGSASSRKPRSSRRKASSSSLQAKSTAARAPPRAPTVGERSGSGNANRAARAPGPRRGAHAKGATAGRSWSTLAGPMPAPQVPTTVPDFVRAFREAFGPRQLIALGERRISYEDAAQHSARLARGLLAHGLAKGARVGVWMPNGPDWVLAWLAAARIGCVVVPINTFSRPRELRHGLHHADVHALLMARHLFGEDALARLEACAPSLARAAAGALHA